MKKARLSVYLDPATMRSLADYAARRDQSLSLIAEAAIASFLSPDAAERQEAVVVKRLDDAVRDGDRIYAVIDAIAGSSDEMGLIPFATAKRTSAGC